MLCKNCGSKNIIKQGWSETKNRRKQIYKCRSCNKKFVESAISFKTYTPQIIYSALITYNLGFTLQESVKIVNKKHKIKLPVSTLHGWLKEFSPLMPNLKFLPEMKKQYQPHNILKHKIFLHNGLQYNFKYHIPKINMRCTGAILYKLKTYLHSITKGTPDYFGNDKRCSQPEAKIQPQLKRQYNLACKMSNFSLKAVRNNRERHTYVEDFMIINDSTTIAVEVPVWFWDKKNDSGISGHIDILQIRKGLVFILDYKPGAEREKKAASQLMLYARALSYRTSISLKNFRCAWFDESDYFEFEPSTIYF